MAAGDPPAQIQANRDDRRVRGATVAGGGAAGAGAASAAPALPRKTAVSASSCQLGNGVKHVVKLMFDNVHFFRDNPNVPATWS